jgi:hypothetical protein
LDVYDVRELAAEEAALSKANLQFLKNALPALPTLLLGFIFLEGKQLVDNELSVPAVSVMFLLGDCIMTARMLASEWCGHLCFMVQVLLMSLLTWIGVTISTLFLGELKPREMLLMDVVAYFGAVILDAGVRRNVVSVLLQSCIQRSISINAIRCTFHLLACRCRHSGLCFAALDSSAFRCLCRSMG